MEISRDALGAWLMGLQDDICARLESADGGAKFITDNWEREKGGGGRTRIIRDGNVIEKGGVLFSAVHGKAPEFLFREQQHSATPGKKEAEFFATGVSIVIHPHSPMVPIIHMNIRYFEMDGNVKWLGGGIDLTPHYVVDDDARFFHSSLKRVCDKHDQNYYPEFSRWADDYFFIRHRNETRGIGGIFFDRLQPNDHKTFEDLVSFWKDTGSAFADIYCELINRNRHKPFTERQKQWQLLRRGRYVEFNLLYDKGTKFGLESDGRVESILMSLPRLAGWEYDFKPEAGSPEEETLACLKKGMKWV